MATYLSILAWEIPWTEEPNRLHSPWGCKRVGHNSVTKQQFNIVVIKQIVNKIQEGSKKKSHFCNTLIIQYIPEHFPKIIRGTLASDETQESTRQ